MSTPEMRPIPQADEIAEAFRVVDQEITDAGGILNLTINALSPSRERDLAREAATKSISGYGMYFTNYEVDEDDPNAFEPVHAFARGFFTAYPVNKILYNNAVTFADHDSTIYQWLHRPSFEEISDLRQQFAAGEVSLSMFGESGMYAAGEIATDIMSKWSEKLYTDPSLGRIYKIGCGTLIRAGIIHQRTINEQYLASATFRASFDQGLASILRGGNAS